MSSQPKGPPPKSTILPNGTYISEQSVMPPLNGPFKLSTQKSNCVLNNDGTLAAMTTNARNAGMILKLLQCGYRIGLDRVLTPTAAS